MTHAHLLSLAFGITLAIAIGCLASYAIIETILAQIDALNSLDISK